MLTMGTIKRINWAVPVVFAIIGFFSLYYLRNQLLIGNDAFWIGLLAVLGLSFVSFIILYLLLRVHRQV